MKEFSELKSAIFSLYEGLILLNSDNPVNPDSDNTWANKSLPSITILFAIDLIPCPAIVTIKTNNNEEQNNAKNMPFGWNRFCR